MTIIVKSTAALPQLLAALYRATTAPAARTDAPHAPEVSGASALAAGKEAR